MERFRIFHKGREVYYYIGEKGTVKSIRIKNAVSNILTPGIGKTNPTDKQGYKQVTIVSNGKRVNKRVHRLVAEKFCPRPGPKGDLEVNHKDGNKHNNNYKNLEWATRSHNAMEAHRLGLIKKPNVKAWKNSNSKYTRDQIIFGLSLMIAGESGTVASKSSGVHRDALYRYYKRRDDLLIME